MKRTIFINWRWSTDNNNGGNDIQIDGYREFMINNHEDNTEDKLVFSWYTSNDQTELGKLKNLIAVENCGKKLILLHRPNGITSSNFEEPENICKDYEQLWLS